MLTQAALHAGTLLMHSSLPQEEMGPGFLFWPVPSTYLVLYL